MSLWKIGLILGVFLMLVIPATSVLSTGIFDTGSPRAPKLQSVGVEPRTIPEPLPDLGLSPKSPQPASSSSKVPTSAVSPGSAILELGPGNLVVASNAQLSANLVASSLEVEPGVALLTEGHAIVLSGMFDNHGAVIGGTTNCGSADQSYGGSGGGSQSLNYAGDALDGYSTLAPGGIADLENNGIPAGSGSTPSPPAMTDSLLATWIQQGTTSFTAGAGGGPISGYVTAGCGSDGVFIQANPLIEGNVSAGGGAGGGTCSGVGLSGGGGGGVVLLVYGNLGLTLGTTNVSGGVGAPSCSHNNWSGAGGNGQLVTYQTSGGTPSTVEIVPSASFTAQNAEECAIGTPQTSATRFANATLTFGNESADLWDLSSSAIGSASLCYETPNSGPIEHVAVSLSQVSLHDPTQSVAGYPSIEYGVCPWGEGHPPPRSPSYNLPLEASGGLINPVWPVASYSITPSNSAGTDFAYDIWLTPWAAPSAAGFTCQTSNAPQNPAFYLEVMVWLNWNGQSPACTGTSCSGGIPGNFETLTNVGSGATLSSQPYSAFQACHPYGDTISYELTNLQSVTMATVGLDLQTIIGDAIALASGCNNDPFSTPIASFYLDQIDLGEEFLAPSSSTQTVTFGWDLSSYCLIAGDEAESVLQLSCPGTAVSAGPTQAMVGPLTVPEAAAVGGGAVTLAAIGLAAWKGWLPKFGQSTTVGRVAPPAPPPPPTPPPG
jgi:hypothetical protein